MKKILIKNAILQDSIFMIDNKCSPNDDDSIKGRMKILKFEKFKLDRDKVETEIDEEYFDNLIGKLDLEYINLNSCESSYFIIWKFYLRDLDDFRFKTIDDSDILDAIKESREDIYYEMNSFDKFIPKIKKKITLFYLLPDEETDYYFELDEGEITEV